MITNFLPKPREIRELSIMFNEGLRGYGHKCEVLIPKVIDVPEIGYEENVGYDDADKFTAYIILDPHPKTTLLNKLGWNSDSNDSKPLLAYISRYLQPIDKPRDVLTSAQMIIPTRFTKFMLEYNYLGLGKEFIVTKSSGDEFNPVYYIVTLVPYRQKVPSNSIPMQDNNTDDLTIEEGNSQFRMINLPRDMKVDIKY